MVTQETTNPSLETLGFDILSTISHILDDAPFVENFKGKKVRSLAVFSKTSRMIREIAVPALFRVIAIQGNWRQCSRRLGRLKNCPAVMHYARSFKFDVYDPNFPPPRQLPNLLVEVMQMMKTLSKFIIILPQFQSDVFKDAFATAAVVLPSIETLVVGPYCDFVVKSCPNVTTVSTNGMFWIYCRRAAGTDREHTMQLINSCTVVEKVTRLEITENWTVELLGAIQTNLPTLQYFGMGGSDYQRNISKMLPALSRFTNLHCLDLIDVAQLGVGFTLLGRGGDTTLRDQQEEDQKRRTEEKRKWLDEVVNMVCKALGPQFKELRIGEVARFEVVRDENGLFEKYIRHDAMREKIEK